MQREARRREELFWLMVNGPDLSRYARRCYRAAGRGVVQIRLAWSVSETGQLGDRLDYRADADPPPGERSWFGEDTARRVATYDPETEFVAYFYYTPDDPSADALGSVHTWHIESRERQDRLLGRGFGMEA